MSHKSSRLPRISVTRPVTITMCLLALLVLGVVSYQRIRVQAFASGWEHRSLYVRIRTPYTSPKEADQQIRIPLEEHLSTVKDLNRIRSWSGGSGVRARLSFRQEVDMDLAYNQVTDRLERLKLILPEEAADNVRVYKYNDETDEEVLWIGVTVPKDIADTGTYTETHVARPLERIDGVARVNIWGETYKEVLIQVDQEKMATRGVTNYDLTQALQGDNFSLAGGYVQEGGKKFFVRSMSKFRSIEEINNVLIRSRAGDLRLNEIAKVIYDVPERGYRERLDGHSAVSVGIYRESGANISRISQAVEKRLQEINAETGIQFNVFFDQGKIIHSSINNLRNTALWGGFFAGLVLLFYLRAFRMTGIITMAIPLCALITVIVLYGIDWSLNMLTMMGLMVGVGMVVDNAIVVVENIYRCRGEGAPARKAAIQGASEVSLAITMATLTTVVVFLPLMIMNGDVDLSFFLLRIGIPVIIALLASLFVALIFIPLAAAKLGGQEVKPDPQYVQRIRNRYRKMLNWTLNHRWDTLLVALVLFATIYIPFNNVRHTDSMRGSLNDFRFSVRAPDFFSWKETTHLAQEFEEFLESQRDKYGIRTVRLNYWRTGLRLQVFLHDDPNTEWWYVAYRNVRKTIGYPIDTKMDRREVIADIREKMPRFVGVRTSIDARGERGSPSVSVFLFGEDVEVLAEISGEVERRLGNIPAVLSVESELERSESEIHVLINREQARKQGISPRVVGRSIAYQLNGSRLPRYQAGEREISVRLQIKEEDRETLTQLKNLSFPTTTGEEVSLATLADFKVAKGSGTIYRQDGKSQLRVRAFTTRQDRRALYADIDQALSGLELPRGYSWNKGENFRRYQESDDAMNLAVLMSIIFVFLLMGVLFESVMLPFAVILSIPFAFLGVYWTLYLTETPMDNMANVGAIVLIGVVVNNAIVLIDRVNQLRKNGSTRREALLEAGQNRFRPILMTTFSTVFGLLPMALGNSALMGMSYAPLGRTMIGGLLFSMTLTLFVVPLFYTFLDDLRLFLKRLTGGTLQTTIQDPIPSDD